MLRLIIIAGIIITAIILFTIICLAYASGAKNRKYSYFRKTSDAAQEDWINEQGIKHIKKKA